MTIYRDRNDWWVGYYRGDTHHYVCPLPTVVIRWPRRLTEPAMFSISCNGVTSQQRWRTRDDAETWLVECHGGCDVPHTIEQR